MSKYFEDSGELKQEYLVKITTLQNEVEAKYQAEYEAMWARDKPLKKAFDDACKTFLEAHKNRDACYGQWMANGNGFSLAEARHKAKDKIMADCMRTFNTLQNELDEKDGTAQKRRELAAACQKLDLIPEKLSLLEEIAKDEAESNMVID